MKELFKARMQTMFIMVFAWSMSGPVLKTYRNHAGWDSPVASALGRKPRDQ